MFDREVVRRRHTLFKGNLISQKFLANDKLFDAQQERLDDDIACWRERLTSTSWFMKIVNECITPRGNGELAPSIFLCLNQYTPTWSALINTDTL